MTVYREPKIKLEEVVQEINERYKIDLKNILLDEKVGYKDIYIYLYILAQSILQKCPDVIMPSKIVDVLLLADYLNIEIVEYNIPNVFHASIEYSFAGCIDRYSGIGSIYLDTKNGINDALKRYNIAIMLAYYIISAIKNNQKMKMQFFFESYFLKFPEQNLCQILASFILMPIDITLEAMLEFINRESIHNDIYDMSEFISRKLGLSVYHELICFNHIRCLGEILYNYDGELEIQDICQKVRSYESLFKG